MQVADAAFDRALLVLGTEVDKATKVTPGDSTVRLLSTSDVGEASDTITIESENELNACEPFNIDPVLVARACKSCSKIGFFNRVVIFGDSDGRFLHLVAHCSN